MDILQIVNRYKPAVGGAEEHVKLISEGLANKDHDVHVWTTDTLTSEDYPNIFGYHNEDPPDLPKHEIINGVTIRRFSVDNRFFSFLWSSQMVEEFRKITKEDYDLIHTHGYHVSLSPLAGYYAERNEIPHIHTAHDLEISESYPKYLEFMKSLYDITIGKKLISDADHLIALTDSQKHQYEKRSNNVNSMSVIPNGIEFDKFDKVNPNKGKEIVENLGINNCFSILYVGRIEEYKGIQDVLTTLEKITHFNIQFVVVGEDFGYRDHLEKQVTELGIENHVSFTGRVDFNELTQLYRESDVFILPSTMEGFGIVLIEAMYNQCICIAREIPATRDVLSGAEFSYLFNSEPELNDQIKKIYDIYENKPGKLKNMKRGVKEHAKRYKAENVVESIEDTYYEVINK